MANHWASAGWEVTLISIDARRVDCYFPPLPQVRLVYLGAAARSGSVGKALFRNGRRVVLLRKAIRTAQAEAVISFLSVTNVLTILATRGLGIPVIVSERGDPDRALAAARVALSAQGGLPTGRQPGRADRRRARPVRDGAFGGAERSSPIRCRPSVSGRTMADGADRRRRPSRSGQGVRSAGPGVRGSCDGPRGLAARSLGRGAGPR